MKGSRALAAAAMAPDGCCGEEVPTLPLGGCGGELAPVGKVNATKVTGRGGGEEAPDVVVVALAAAARLPGGGSGEEAPFWCTPPVRGEDAPVGRLRAWSRLRVACPTLLRLLIQELFRGTERNFACSPGRGPT